MRHRWLVVTMMSGMLLVLSAVEPIPVVGQGAKPYSPRRMPDGKPDLQGTYDLATLTPLERPAGMKAVLTREEVGEDRAWGCCATGGRRSADSRRARGAAQGRRRVRRCCRQRRRLQLVLARSRLDLHDRQRRNSHVDRRRSARWPHAGVDSRRAGSALPRVCSRAPARCPTTTVVSRPRRVPTTIRSAVRSASVVCSASGRRRALRHCRITSTTTCTRSCRRRTRCSSSTRWCTMPASSG